MKGLKSVEKSKILVVAGLFDLLWGITTIISPQIYFVIFSPLAPYFFPSWLFWSVTSISIGFLFLFTASNFYKYWPLLSIGWVYKVAVFIAIVLSIFSGAWPATGLIPAFAGGLVWVPSLSVLLLIGYKFYIKEEKLLEDEVMLEQEFESVSTYSGKNLKDLSEHNPIMLVFLRHLGCQFCKEMLKNLSKMKDEIHLSGKKLVLVHMSDPNFAESMLKKFGLSDAEHISDTNRALYRYFGLGRGFFTQVFGWQDLKKGFLLFVKKGYRIKMGLGDILQMPGLFIYFKGKIKMKYIHKHISDIPNYEQLLAYQPIMASK